MVRYYFDIRNASGFHHDDYGDEFATFEQAREQCQGVLPEIARGELPDGEMHVITCDVRDETGQVVYQGKLTYEGTRFPSWMPKLS